ncbi:hypothetical protein GCM10027169_25200 [Gordonia jinhuaensis]|uniref:Uncharacterized protein n=1 Tax=Gordonia jinhuaensis TaxID=1517702 RepID=A0A916TBW9_9ACTN|nr:hypothetical protein GCM10011489_28800 [Gordonia jinhuaensis]
MCAIDACPDERHICAPAQRGVENSERLGEVPHHRDVDGRTFQRGDRDAVDAGQLVRRQNAGVGVPVGPDAATTPAPAGRMDEPLVGMQQR